VGSATSAQGNDAAKPLEGGFVRIKQGGYCGRCKACRAARRRARYRDDPAFRAAQQARERHRERRQRRRDQPRPAVPRADPEAILAYVAGLSGVPVATLVGPSRLSTVIAPRAVALHLLRVEGKLTMVEVGRVTGRSTGTVERLTQWVRRPLQRGASLEDRRCASASGPPGCRGQAGPTASTCCSLAWRPVGERPG